MKRLLLLFLWLFTLSMSSNAYCQWEYLGESSSSVIDIAAHNGVLLATGGKKTLLSTDGGSNWTTARESEFKSVTWAGTGFYLGSGRGEDFLTDAQGMNWTQRGYCSYEENWLHFDTTTGALYCANMRGNAILKSTDTGGIPSTNTWLPIGGGPQDQTYIQVNGDRMISYYNGINGFAPSGLIYSLNGGMEWKLKSWPFYNLGQQFGYTTAAWLTPGGTMYATSATGPAGKQISTLWRSKNGGESWDSLFAVNEVTPILLAGTIYSEGKNILFSAGTQLWLSNDDGVNWKQMQDGILATPSGGVREIVLTNGYVIALFKNFVNGQTGFGLYRRPLADFGFTGIADVVSSKSSSSAHSVVLQHDLNGDATIHFVTSSSRHVRLVAYDLLGRETSLIFDGLSASGDNRINVPASMHGTFVVRLIADEESCAAVLSN